MQSYITRQGECTQTRVTFNRLDSRHLYLNSSARMARGSDDSQFLLYFQENLVLRQMFNTSEATCWSYANGSTMGFAKCHRIAPFCLCIISGLLGQL